MPVIVFAIKSIFFSKADSYNFERKSHMSHFFLLFYGEMIRVICAMLTIAIKDLEIRFDNPNLLLSKRAIRFELLAQKLETNK